MNTRIHIERLIVNAAPMSRAQEQQLRTSLTEELTRLVKQGRLSSQILAGGRLNSLSARMQANTGATSPAGMGKQIANAVYSGIGAQQSSMPLKRNPQIRVTK